jgi:hypothetical protein
MNDCEENGCVMPTAPHPTRRFSGAHRHPACHGRVRVMGVPHRDIQDLPGHAVAASLGLSTTAMKSRLHRARIAIREALDESPTESA